MKRPVWLFSLDSEHFHAAPTATGGLIAWYRVYGQTPDAIDFRQIHFREREDVATWTTAHLAALVDEANTALAAGLQPIIGISFYTWNAAEFLELSRQLRRACPGITIIAGGPHVQQAETYLGIDPIDVIVFGEGEAAFQELLDTPMHEWSQVPGIAFLQDGAIVKTSKRERQLDLAQIPSPFDVLELTDANGKPLYDAVAYETSRGCPYKCSFCEWGTGAIGTKMVSFPIERLKHDWEKIAKAGIPNIWLADSNFGALKSDIDKARIICDLKQRYDLPRTFATSWSKKHSPRVQEIVLMLHDHGLLPHYQLALQTLTPLALELCHRENMDANEYEPIARKMADAGIPISAELIWGLPGDNLASFEKNLDTLLATFPSINIFGYTLLPGTEFYEKRTDYNIQTIPVAGYGKAKGEYVVGCHTFDSTEGGEGYFLITGHMVLIHGHMLSRTTRYLALEGSVPAGSLLRAVTDALVHGFADALPGIDPANRMQVYESRADIYLTILKDRERCYRIIHDTVLSWLEQHNGQHLIPVVSRILQLDSLFCPRYGQQQYFEHTVDFNARAVLMALRGMNLPAAELFDGQPQTLSLRSPGGVGDVLKNPDGGSWLKSQLLDDSTPSVIAWQPASADDKRISVTP
ncbi:MAG: B12-binding domain-containing radical SAM protein [Gammaproteobacteria bacterium]|nr:MAG: B12-binding domain-containing radical SAM protein [Gammaproteobacteria bacterium]